MYFKDNKNIKSEISEYCLAAGYFFENLKGPRPFNFKKYFQRLKT
jgi:hypothetical protein